MSDLRETSSSTSNSDPLGGYKGQVVVVFQGGGALGAYQVGVYRALCEAGIEPTWVIGTSIGAINAAIIAGNAPADRMEKLDAFWDTVRSNDFDPTFGLGGAMLSRHFRNVGIVSNGVNGFFRPNPKAHLAFGGRLPATEAAYYLTEPLAATLKHLIDFDRLNDPTRMRVALGAVNVVSGLMHYFDSRDSRLDIRHVMASGALPPAFPAVDIDGELYWDGGIYSNTPVEAVMNDRPRLDSLIFSVNLWHGTGEPPRSIADVNARAKDIQFASRSDSHVRSEQKLHRLRHIIRELGSRLPETLKLEPEIQDYLSWGCQSTMQMLRFHAPRIPGEDASKDIDFSRDGIRARNDAGYEAALRALERKPWICDVNPFDGIIVHDV